MKRYIMCVCLLLCVLVSTVGCSSRKSDPVYEPEDYEATTRRTQEAALATVAEYYIANNCIYFNPDIPEGKAMFVAFLDILGADDSGLSFDMESIQASFTGYSVQLITPLDAYGNRMTFWAEMPDEADDHYVLTISSTGADGEMQFLGSYDIASGKEGDDIFSYVEGHPAG